MPPVLDLEYYARLQPGPGTGPGRSLAAFLTYAIRDQATVMNIGPTSEPDVIGAEFWRLIDGKWQQAIPPPIAVAGMVARFLKMLVAGNGVLTLKIGERTLDVYVEFTPRQHADEINVTLPASSALQGPAARLLDSILGPEGYLVFNDEEFDEKVSQRDTRSGFQLLSKVTPRSGDGPPFLGCGRMPFHPDMHQPTKFLIVMLMMCFHDRARELEFRQGADEMSTRYLVDKWYECVPPPAFVWPQLVRVIERHAILIRPNSSDLDVPAVGWLELRWGQDLPPDNLAVFLDPRKDSGHIRITFMRVAPETQSESKATESPTQEADDRNDEMVIEFSPDDQ